MPKIVVWKRNDGYIGCSLYLPQDWLTGGTDELDEQGKRKGSGIPVTFEQLAEFPEWNREVYDYIYNARKAAGHHVYAKNNRTREV